MSGRVSGLMVLVLGEVKVSGKGVSREKILGTAAFQRCDRGSVSNTRSAPETGLRAPLLNSAHTRPLPDCIQLSRLQPLGGLP